MTDILLVQPRVNQFEPMYVPTGLMALAAYVEDEFSVKILDTRAEPDWRQKLKAELDSKPLLVGVSSMSGPQIGYALEISKFAKEYAPDIPVLWGGVHPTYLPEQTLENPNVDMIATYQGEETLLELARQLANPAKLALGEIRGLAYKRQGEIVVNPRRGDYDGTFNLMKVPRPAWHLVDVPKYIDNLSTTRNRRTLDVITSRGCPYRCKFCYVMTFYNRKWMARDNPSVIEEMQELHDRFGANHYLIHDDLFIVNKQSQERALAIGRGINSGGRSITFSMQLRVNMFDRPFLEKLTHHGLAQIRAGVESGSERVLKHMSKDITVHQILESAKIAKELGFAINYSFVIGWPQETDEDRKATVELCLRLFDANPAITIYPLWIYVPYPGTPFYDEAIQSGFHPPSSLDEWGRYWWGRVTIPWLVNKDKYEDMHTLSKFLFSTSARGGKLWTSLWDSNVKPSVKLRRVVSAPVAQWAKLRFKTGFWAMPYEHKVLEPLLSGRA